MGLLNTYVRMAVHRLGSERGQTLAEYGLIVAVIAVVVIVAALLFGNSTSSLFSSSAGRV